ncbi:MAG: hypothetical protein HOV80_16930 [Polyangiaceae bacterium]|nr:hypothetical protein [Polyangiaceae bacterium]
MSLTFPYRSLVAVAIAGCAVDVTPNGVGKPCPCDEGSICRDVTNTCEPAIGTCEAAIKLSEVPEEAFRPVYWTPGSVRWEWLGLGNSEEFGRYELFLGPTADSVAPGSKSARVFDASVNPELAFLFVPNPSGGPVVFATTTDGLEPLDPLVPEAGKYFARLEVRDKSGCPFTSAVISRDTQRARVCPRVVFDESAVEGALPPDSHVEAGCGLNGSSCLVCRSADGCLTPAGLFVSLPHTDTLEDISANDFQGGRAMLELSVMVTSDQPIFYAEVGIAIEAAPGVCGAVSRWKASDVFLRPGGLQSAWQTLQIPLSALRDEAGRPADHAEVITSTWCAVHFRADPGAATEIRFDRVAGCW